MSADANEKKKLAPRHPGFNGRTPFAVSPEPTIAEKKRRREQKLLDAEAALAACTDDDLRPELEEARLRAKIGVEANLDPNDIEDRLRVALDLMATMPLGKARDAFGERYGLSPAASRRWLERAAKDRGLGVELHRESAVTRLQELATKAEAAGDFKSASWATVQAAKLAGVSEKVEVVATRGEDIPAEFREVLADPLFAVRAAYGADVAEQMKKALPPGAAAQLPMPPGTPPPPVTNDVPEFAGWPGAPFK